MACDNRAFVTRRETHCVMDNGGAKRTREDAAPPEKRACGETLSAAQARAVEIAAAGRSLALLGPAGTGKSLAVAHIRAALVARSRAAPRTRASRAPFGGMQVIVVGDFAQLAPVEGDFAFTAKCWDALFGATTVVLTEVFRQRDAEFVAALHALRTNTLAPAQF